MAFSPGEQEADPYRSHGMDYSDSGRAGAGRIDRAVRRHAAPALRGASRTTCSPPSHAVTEAGTAPDYLKESP